LEIGDPVTPRKVPPGPARDPAEPLVLQSRPGRGDTSTFGDPLSRFGAGPKIPGTR
jgi:hypothetical protein